MRSVGPQVLGLPGSLGAVVWASLGWKSGDTPWSIPVPTGICWVLAWTFLWAGKGEAAPARRKHQEFGLAACRGCG